MTEYTEKTGREPQLGGGPGVTDGVRDEVKIGLDDVITITEGDKPFAKYRVDTITFYPEGQCKLMLSPLGTQ